MSAQSAWVRAALALCPASGTRARCRRAARRWHVVEHLTPSGDWLPLGAGELPRRAWAAARRRIERANPGIVAEVTR